MEYGIVIIIFLIGVWALIVLDNLVKKIIALNIINTAVILFFILIGYREGATAPIILPGTTDVVDPLPQALMLTAIVIGLAVTSFALVLIIRIYRAFNTINMSEIEKKGTVPFFTENG